MNAKSWQIGLVVASSLLVALRADARATGPFTMGIQEIGTATSAELGPGMADRPVRLSVVDGRSGADLTVIGEISDHADKVFPIQISNDPIPWANEVLKKEAAASGIKVEPDAPLSLTGKLTQLRLVASTKAVGSTYSAQIQVAFTLADSRGRTLWTGTTEGGSTRYGKERSGENANEVLNDALREVYTNAFEDSGLQGAWTGGKPVASSSSSASARSRFRRAGGLAVGDAGRSRQAQEAGVHDRPAGGLRQQEDADQGAVGGRPGQVEERRHARGGHQGGAGAGGELRREEEKGT